MTPTQDNSAVTPLLNRASKQTRSRSLLIPLMGALILCQFIALWASWSSGDSQVPVAVERDTESRFAPAAEIAVPPLETPDAGLQEETEA